MTPYAREVGAVIVLAALAGWSWLAYDYGHGKGMDKRAGELKELRAEYVAQNVEWANARLESSEAARALELADAQRKAEAGEYYERGKRDAQVSGDRVTADLRAGNLKLRNHWQACLATTDLSAAATDAGQPDANADLRSAGAGDLVRLVDQCDAWIGSLQRVAP